MHLILICVEALLIGAPYAFPDLPSLLGTLMFWAGAVGLVITLAWLAISRTPLKNSLMGIGSVSLDSARMPLLNLYDLAEKSHDWDFAGRESLDLLDFVHGLRQAGSDAVISFWGRRNRNDAESLNRNEIGEDIGVEHWREYTIEFWKPRADRDNYFFWTLNNRSTNNKQGGYTDLHVNRQQAIHWLKRDANSNKGVTKR